MCVCAHTHTHTHTHTWMYSSGHFPPLPIDTGIMSILDPSSEGERGENVYRD